MQIFETTITVTKQDLDELNHVNNVRYVQWVEDIAKTHWETQTPSKILDAYFWVMINHFITYKSEALLNDIVTLKRMLPNPKASDQRVLLKSSIKKVISFLLNLKQHGVL